VGLAPATMTLEQDPEDLAHHEAEIAWVVDRMAGSDLDRELGEFVPRWLNDAWGFRAVDYSP
jgi:hypothetical protein